MSVEGEVIARGITNDATYVGRFARDLNDPAVHFLMETTPLCMTPYFSLFVYESYQKLKVANPALPAFFSEDTESIVARSRHRLKLFEDTKQGIDKQLACFRDDILPGHYERFHVNARLKLARFLEKDLALYNYNGKLIATTHSKTFFLGVNPVALFGEGVDVYLRGVYEEYGRYFGGLGANLETGAETFVAQLKNAPLDVRSKNVRADGYYRHAFNGEGSPDLNALLSVFRGMMNFVDAIVGGGGERGVEYTELKIRFLTLYQVLRSLQILREERPGDLTARSSAFIEKMTTSPVAKLITDPAVKPFRNTLVHYSLDSRVNVANVDVTEPLFGLVCIYFPAYETVTFAEAIDACIGETATAMEEWAAA
jgi:hypothetical protein